MSNEKGYKNSNNRIKYKRNSVQDDGHSRGIEIDLNEDANKNIISDIDMNLKAPKIKNIDYPKSIKQSADEKGSKSARRSTAKSIGGEKERNCNELVNLKCGKTDRTTKSYREQYEEKNQADNSHLPHQKYQSLTNSNVQEMDQYRNSKSQASQRNKFKNNLMKGYKTTDAEEQQYENQAVQEERDYSTYLEDEKLANRGVEMKRNGRQNGQNSYTRNKNQKSNHLSNRSPNIISPPQDSFPFDDRRVKTELDQHHGMDPESEYPREFSHSKYQNEGRIRQAKRISPRKQGRQIDEYDMPIEDRHHQEDLREAEKYLNYDSCREYNVKHPEFSNAWYSRPEEYDEEEYGIEDNILLDDEMYKNSFSVNQIYDETIDSGDDEYMTIKYCKEYISKMEEDMNKMHNRHLQMIKEIEEDFQKDNQHEFLEWKNNARTRIKNYKRAIEELIKEQDKIDSNKNLTISKLKDEISQLKNQMDTLTKQYQQDQELWELEKEEIVNKANAKKEFEIKKVMEEAQGKMIDYEGQIEELKAHLRSLKQANAESNSAKQINSSVANIEKYTETLKAKYEDKIKEIQQKDLQLSVKS